MLSYFRLDRKTSLFFLLSGLFPVSILALWNHYSRFYVVYDDGEYWHQAFTILRQLQNGEAGLVDLYRFNVGRPSIHFIYGLLAVLLTGQGVSVSTKIVLSFFYAQMSFAIFLFANRVCRCPVWSFVIAATVLLQANYFFTAELFLSELPYFCCFCWSAYFFLRSDFLLRTASSCIAGIFAGLAICSRPVEATILYCLVSVYLLFLFFKEKKVSIIALFPFALAMALNVFVFSNYFITYRLKQNDIFYFLPVVWLLVFTLGLFLKGRSGNFSVFVGSAAAIVSLWFLPRLLPMWYWFNAATYPEKMLFSELFQIESLKNMGSLVWMVSNEMAGPHFVALSILVIAYLFFNKKFSQIQWILPAAVILVAAILPGSFVKNPSTREAIDRYYLGEILVLYVGLGISIWKVSENKIRFLFGSMFFLFGFFNLFLILDQIYWNRIQPNPATNRWLFRSAVRVAVRTENHFSLSAVDQINALLKDPFKPAKIYLSPGNDIAHRYIVLRGLELNNGWRIDSALDMDPFPKGRAEADFAGYYDYVLAGPLEDGEAVKALVKKISAQGGTLLGKIDLKLSERKVQLGLYKVR